MEKIVESKLKIESWDEKPYRELGDGSKFSRAEVTLSGTDDVLTAGTFESLLFYRPDGTSSYVSLLQVTAALDGRTGTFVLRGGGTFDGTTARVSTTVVEGSATGDLAGLRGTAESASTHADYPHMPLTLTYELE
jgi:Protein of unknown function (DUF3224)